MQKTDSGNLLPLQEACFHALIREKVDPLWISREVNIVSSAATRQNAHQIIRLHSHEQAGEGRLAIHLEDGSPDRSCVQQ